MNKFFQITLILSLCIYFIPSASAGSENNGTKATQTLKSSGSKISKRPRIPNGQEVVCAYDNEVVEIQFKYPEGDANVKIGDGVSGETQVYYIDTSSCSIIPLPTDYGNVCLQITTEMGNVYEGMLIL